MTRDQKRRLAAALIRAAGDLVAGGAEFPAVIPKDIDRAEAAQQLAQWLKDLPGDAWDNELPQPVRKSPKFR